MTEYEKLRETALAKFNETNCLDMNKLLDIFADLMVERCVNLCNVLADEADEVMNWKSLTEDNKLVYDGIWRGSTNCAELIKTHFGYKE